MQWRKELLNIVICENDINDQEFINKNVIKILDDLKIEYEIKIYNSGENLIESYNNDTDIILLDIQMDGIDGMETARKIREFDNRVEIIFITSFAEYALEGYEVKAYRYLLKPVKYDDLKVSLINCLSDINLIKRSIVIREGDTSIKLSEVKAYRYLLKPVKYDDLKVSLINCLSDINLIKRSIVIREGDTSIKLSLKDIMYIEVQRNDIIIHKLDKVYTTKGTMNNFENEINNDVFVRCHKSYLLNLEYIKSIKRYSAILSNEEEVPLSSFENEINNDVFVRCHKSYLLNLEYIKSIKRYSAILSNEEEVPLSRNKYKEIKDKFFDLIEDKLC